MVISEPEGIIKLEILNINFPFFLNRTFLLRVTALPDAFDIVPVRNQILEIDLENTSITTSIDTTEIGDVNVASSSQLATSSTTSIASGY